MARPAPCVLEDGCSGSQHGLRLSFSGGVSFGLVKVLVDRVVVIAGCGDQLFLHLRGLLGLGLASDDPALAVSSDECDFESSARWPDGDGDAGALMEEGAAQHVLYGQKISTGFETGSHTEA